MHARGVLAYLRTVVKMFDPPRQHYEPIVAIGRGGDGFVLTTQARGVERRYAARRLILATGGTDHPRPLDTRGEDLPHVSRYFQDPHLYFERKLLIIGGKNSAVEAALRCLSGGSQRIDQLSARAAQSRERQILAASGINGADRLRADRRLFQYRARADHADRGFAQGEQAFPRRAPAPARGG